ncbi:MAG TPA: fused MFS/spermidine synthase [Aestuariivirga sp.]|nr:fused MFS/spermidine synthase [Aestuariivirga sp.]
MQFATEAKPAAQASIDHLNRATRTVFTMAIFTSAFLLFAIQPMFTKMILPQLGGSPGVWSVAMVFFQAVLLLGYLYAHLSTRYLTPRTAIYVHVGLLLVTFIALPISIASGLGKPPAEGQAFWLIGVFTFSVGLPFFAVAGNGPLLQAWFARTHHRDAGNPYFLYAASNLGSFAALLLYPLIFETTLRLPQQSLGWSIGFIALALLIAASGYVLQLTTAGPKVGVIQSRAAAGPKKRLIGEYIWLSFIPSALLVAVTAHISTDIAPAPFLWVIPLALYLLTFVLIFRDKPLVPTKLVGHLVPVLAGVIILSKVIFFNIFLSCALHLGFFLVVALMFHQRLYNLRPSAEHLTQFYLWMSFGGVLGGIFSGLLAPFIFDRILEYPILIGLVMLAHLAVLKASRLDFVKEALPVFGLALLLAAGIYLFREHDFVNSSLHYSYLVALASLAIIGLFVHQLARAALIIAALVAVEISPAGFLNTYERSFFGVHKIYLRDNGQFRALSHGTTLHGAIRVRNPDGSKYTGPITPLAYYHPNSVLAQTLLLLPPQINGRDVAVVGLGPGAHSCNGLTRDRWTYFEIDPVVIKIARDPDQFGFLSHCAPTAKIVLGDARLTLAEQPESVFDYLLIDAFSSDTIPIHLLTREAIALYVSRLKDGGVLVIHISNRHLELQSVVAALARDANIAIKTRIQISKSTSLGDPNSSEAAIFARQPETLARYTEELGWKQPTNTNVAVWTDDYSNILGAIWRKYSK